MADSENKIYVCPLCGHKFDEGSKKCLSCPMAGKSCKVVCCPNCGYSFTEESQIAEWFKKLFGARGSDGGKKQQEK